MSKRIDIPPTGEFRLLANRATPEIVQQTMAQLIRQLAVNDTATINAANVIGEDSRDFKDYLQKLANFAYFNAYFVPDPPTRQLIRTPRATLRDQRANCVDYTILIGAIAKRAGLPVVVRIVQLPGQSSYGHVYPVINGVAVDVVPGQDQSGMEAITRKSYKLPCVGVELKFLRNIDAVV
jgi:transglutaminase-like putative cysteine protease